MNEAPHCLFSIKLFELFIGRDSWIKGSKIVFWQKKLSLVPVVGQAWNHLGGTPLNFRNLQFVFVYLQIQLWFPSWILKPLWRHSFESPELGPFSKVLPMSASRIRFPVSTKWIFQELLVWNLSASEFCHFDPQEQEIYNQATVTYQNNRRAQSTPQEGFLLFAGISEQLMAMGAPIQFHQFTVLLLVISVAPQRPLQVGWCVFCWLICRWLAGRL